MEQYYINRLPPELEITDIQDLVKFTENKFFIFLDIDSVLNSSSDIVYIQNARNNNKSLFDIKELLHRWPNRRFGDFVNIEKLSMIQEISKAYPFLMFINISAWLHSADHVSELCTLFNLPYLMNNPMTSGGYGRGEGIKEVVEYLGFKSDQYMVIDDIPYEYFKFNVPVANFLHIADGKGLLPSHIAHIQSQLSHFQITRNIHNEL